MQSSCTVSNCLVCSVTPFCLTFKLNNSRSQSIPVSSTTMATGQAYSSVFFKTLPYSSRFNLDSFRDKRVIEWNVDDLVGWMIHVARKYGIPLEEMDMHRFSGCTGSLLFNQTEKNFVERNPKFGALLFKEFLMLSVGTSGVSSLQSVLNSTDVITERPSVAKAHLCLLSKTKSKHSLPKTTASNGRSVRLKCTYQKSCNKLWEFMRNALLDPETCPSLIRWEDRDQGVFRIVESEKIARLWGMKKNNSRMTYEKLSRAMRYYYNRKIILPVTGRRLVYRFGPNATNWKPTK